MKSFFSFFVLFLVGISSIFVIGYSADRILQKNIDLTIYEWSWINISDHRIAYTGVVYTWFMDGIAVPDVSTPGLLLDWHQLSSQTSSDGNNQIARKLERVMKDDYQESKEYMANVFIKNTAPQIFDARIEDSSLDGIKFSFSALDAANSDYPLTAFAQLKNLNGSVVSEQSFSIPTSEKITSSFTTQFVWCNNDFILSLMVKDDLDTVVYTTPIHISCPVSTTIDIQNDTLSTYIYTAIISKSMYTKISSDKVKISLYDPSSFMKYTTNILFFKWFLQAITDRKILSTLI